MTHLLPAPKGNPTLDPLRLPALLGSPFCFKDEETEASEAMCLPSRCRCADGQPGTRSQVLQTPCSVFFLPCRSVWEVWARQLSQLLGLCVQNPWAPPCGQEPRSCCAIYRLSMGLAGSGGLLRKSRSEWRKEEMPSRYIPGGGRGSHSWRWEWGAPTITERHLFGPPRRDTYSGCGFATPSLILLPAQPSVCSQNTSSTAKVFCVILIQGSYWRAM